MNTNNNQGRITVYRSRGNYLSYTVNRKSLSDSEAKRKLMYCDPDNPTQKEIEKYRRI